MIWRFRPWPKRNQLDPLIQQMGLSPLAAAVYLARGFCTLEDLNPPLELLPIVGLDEAAERVLRAIARKERIRIHGDYDADGLTGTSVLLLGLSELGANVHAFVPHRLDEGYGVYLGRVPEHAETCNVFITVDCGISNHTELQALVDAGTSVIVTDHHSPGAQLPPGVLVHPALSPNLEGQPHPTGVGVAYLLLWRVRQKLGLPAPLHYADLAAIGTIADVAPLKGFNRALVQAGLQQMRQTRHLGLAELAQQQCKDFTASEIAFRIAPRINAASRLGQADLALETLTTSDPYAVRPLVETLNVLNTRRQRIEEEMLQRVLPTLDPQAPALVIDDSQGHPGVMGIVASRVLERFYKPVFIAAQGKGSVRSTPGISAVGGLRHSAHLLKRYGGHAQAAGFAIDPERMEDFRQSIYSYVAQFPVPIPQLLLEGSLEGQDYEALHESLSALEPMGEGNPEPVFYLQGRPEGVRNMGDNRQHLSFRLGGRKVVRWRDTGEHLPKDQVEVAAALTANEWMGERQIELRALAYRAPSPLEANALVWAYPHNFSEALKQALEQKAPVYVGSEGANWFAERGVPVVAPLQAQYWFALPAATQHLSKVTVALSEKALAALLHASDALQQHLAQRIKLAYQNQSPELLSEAIEAWWEAAD